MSDSIQINIRPTTGVYAKYRYLSYKPWTAVAEFIDNSTQSYFDHRDELKQTEGFDRLHVKVEYSQTNGTMVITDNAYGMEFEDFKRAITLDSPPKDTSGRNEFGMGLKTAACWFGNCWTVRSTQLGSNVEYTATVDVDDLSKFKPDFIDMQKNLVSHSEHYTIITIEKLNKKIIGGRAISKMKDMLKSMYREDLRSGEVCITYNGDSLQYTAPGIYIDTSGRTWKRDITFAVSHDNEELPVSGYIAIRDVGSVENSGLTLMRRGRVIENNYRPTEIFGQANSYPYQRIIGELKMDKWPVTQAKDKFDWENDDLEITFINMLKPLMQEYVNKAATIRKVAVVDTEKVIKNAVSSLHSVTAAKVTAIDDGAVLTTVVPPKDANGCTEIFSDTTVNKKSKSSEDGTVPTEPTESTLVGSKDHIVEFKYDGEKYRFKVSLDDSNSERAWIVHSVEKDDDGDIHNVIVNLAHPFFKNYRNDSKCSEMLVCLAISMVLSEVVAKYTATDGMVEPSYIRNEMNQAMKSAPSGLSPKDN